MAELAAGFLGPAIEVVKWVGAPIMRQFNYLCCFTANIKNLEEEALKLDDAAEGIQWRVDRAEENVQVIDPEVKTWLAESKKIKDQKTTILVQVPNVGSVCLNLRARFSLSKTAKKTADRMKVLRDERRKFSLSPETAISLPGPPAAREAVQLGKTYEFESRKQIEEDIMTILKSGDVSMIGICGMGGLGKTTMAKRIMNRVLKEHVFEEAVIAVVSQPVDKSKIQLEIGGSLGLKLDEETSEAVKIQKLHARLSGTKRILLVLDDVWEQINLEEFGIPRDSKGCTILITSRNRDALRKMDVQKVFGMEILSEDEALFLFKEKAGTCMDAAELKSIAEGVVKECEGLPIALETVGATLKDENDPSVWRDALRQLSQCDPDIPEYIAKVYNPLKLSYDLLSSKHAKSIFLLCCLYPEDASISVEELTCFGMGLGIFEGIRDLEEVRNRVSTLIKMLKSRCLLLDGEKRDGPLRIHKVVRDDYVRMHDVIRDVCIFIAKQEGYVGTNNCSWISSFELPAERANLTNLSTGLRSPNLRLLFLSHYNYSKQEGLRLSTTFFEGISDIFVLTIRGHKSLTSLPPTNSLKSLVLDSCHGLETIFVVGEFVNLEILICRNCPLIEELPMELKRLNSLKLLEFTRCKNLQRVGQGIISSLFGLEELKMLYSFKRWESEDREERENVGLRELEALTNLRCLEIEIEDPTLATGMMHLSSKIKRFHIIIGTRPVAAMESNDHSYNKRMVLESKREEHYIGYSIEMQLLRDTEYLYLSGNSADRVDLAICQNIRCLELTKCEKVKTIVTTSMVDDATAVPTSLEHLILRSLPKLERVCDGPITSNSFHNLKELTLVSLEALKQLWKRSTGNIYVPPLFSNLSSINIEGCNSLCNLGQLSIAGKDCLPQLQELVIRKCEMMEQVFWWNNSESQSYHCTTKVFPKLKKVELHNLPNLVTFYQGMGSIEFPLLMECSILECPKLKSMGSNPNSGGSNAGIDDYSLQHLFCRPKKVSFASLKELRVGQWNPFCGHEIHASLLNGLEVLTFSKLYGIMSLFSSPVARNLVNLRILNIRECDEMLKVIEDNKEEEEEKVVSGGEAILFPKLEKLKFKDLPKLVTFCEWKCDLKLPSLREVITMRCPDMDNLSFGLLNAPNLEAFTTDVNNNLQIGVSFNSLKELGIRKCEKPFYGHKFFISIFNGLKKLEVRKCHGSMRCLFTSSIARCLDSLEVLMIEECHEIVKVIEDEEKVGSGGERTILFPKLKRLGLIYLPKLLRFCDWKCDIELPSLTNVYIMNCTVLKNFTMGVIATAPNLENISIEYTDIDVGTKDLNSVVQQYMGPTEVPFHDDDDLKEVVLGDRRNLFCSQEIPLFLLKGLEVLTFSRVYGGTSLFPSVVAGNLVNLRVLYITECDEILEVIENNKEENEKVVRGTAEMPLILFPKLEELTMEDLPKLVTFCDLKCDINLPSLRKVAIWRCPVLKNLTMGSIVAAPNLENIETSYGSMNIIGGTKDLNSMLRQLMQEEMKKMEGGEEEEEIKGEIEEEEDPQN